MKFFFQSCILEELTNSSDFVSTPSGWKLASSGMPPVAKKRKVEISYDISNAIQTDQPVFIIYILNKNLMKEAKS